MSERISKTSFDRVLSVEPNTRTERQTILITGATGYVGGQLLRALREGSHHLRCLTRQPDALRGKAGSGVEVIAGDVLAAESVQRAMVGVDTAYYLVHSMGSTASFEDQDRDAARIFAEAAREAEAWETQVQERPEEVRSSRRRNRTARQARAASGGVVGGRRVEVEERRRAAGVGRDGRRRGQLHRGEDLGDGAGLGDDGDEDEERNGNHTQTVRSACRARQSRLCRPV